MLSLSYMPLHSENDEKLAINFDDDDVDGGFKF